MCFVFYFSDTYTNITTNFYSQKGQHALWKYIGGGNSHAPLRYDIDRILDSGCGLGEWTMVSVLVTVGRRRKEEQRWMIGFY
jgi:hypothetical protein